MQTDAPTGLKREWYMLCHASMRAFHRPCDMCQYTQSCAVRGVVQRTERGSMCTLLSEVGCGGLRLKPQNAAKLADGAAEAPV